MGVQTNRARRVNSNIGADERSVDEAPVSLLPAIGPKRKLKVSNTPSAAGIVQPLSLLVRWSRSRYYERLAEVAGIQLCRSAITILDMLNQHGTMRTSELAQRMGLDRSTISRQVGWTITLGFVSRIEDISDGRAALLSLTQEGQAMQKKLAKAWRAIGVDLIADWPEDEQAAIGRLMTKLAQRIESDYPA